MGWRGSLPTTMAVFFLSVVVIARQNVGENQSEAAQYNDWQEERYFHMLDVEERVSAC